MDIGAYTDAVVAGVPLLFVVIGLVQWVKSSGWVQGAIVNVVSMLIGLIIGCGYMIAKAVPTDFAGWFAMVVYGLGLGIVASGIYKVGSQLADQAGWVVTSEDEPDIK